MVTIKGSIHAPASAPSPPLTASPSAGASDCDHDDRNNHDNSPPFSITSIREPTNPISAISSFNSGSKEDDKRNKDREESSPSPSPSRRRTSGEPSRPALTANLGEILKNLDLLRRGVHPALGTACDCLELPLEPLEYPLFKEYVCEPPVTPSSSLNLDLDLDSIRRWAQNKLHWDFDPDRARLIIRMATTLHQIVAKKLKDLFMERFEVAISNSTRPERGTISERGDILHTFKNPAPTLEPPVESGQQEQATQQTLPRRTAPKRDAAEPEPEPHTNASTSSDAPETKPGSEADDSEDDTSSVRKGALTEYVHCPDVGLLYTPPDREMDYFPGFILEVGYSHPLDDATAKRYIRLSDGQVRYVMAFNIQYNANRQTRGKITITAHELVCTEDSWFPKKCLDSFDVRAIAAATHEVDSDIGLRLSHLHESLPHTQVKIPLQTCIDIVEEAFQTQEFFDKYGRGQSRPPPPTSTKGKRMRTPTPEDDPDSNYTDSSAHANSPKRRKTSKNA